MAPLKTSDFHYHLPRSLIAQKPASRREASRLLVYRGEPDLIDHRSFNEIGDYLCGSALLVLNDTKVIPARLLGKKSRTGGRVEILLLREIARDRWECLLKPSARVRDGAEIVFDESSMKARVAEGGAPGTHSVFFEGADDFWSELDRIGQAPLPPYIKRPGHGARGTGQEDRERYQTVYAKRRGAVAAPTAGLHFSEGLLSRLKAKGVDAVYLTLHVGLGTFRPVKEEFVRDHGIHAEYFVIGNEAAERINGARGEGRRVVVVGTTTARALETVADDNGYVKAQRGWTHLFIYPPYRFKTVENLLTNFHLPCSTLLMLVAALAGREKVLELYEIAKRDGYRFYSYGDAMLILNPKSQISKNKNHRRH